MRLRNEFTVAAPLERTWQALLDVPRVASALPGASISPDGSDGAYRGTMRVKIGPVTAEYAGTARLEEIDEDAHVASFRVQGTGGAGTAAATIVGRVEPAEGGASRVVVETDLRVTGRAATFGRGLMEDVASRMLAEFAQRLEREITAPSAVTAPRSAPGAVERESALDLGAAAWEPLLRRYGVPALLVLVLVLLLRRPKVIVIKQS